MYIPGLFFAPGLKWKGGMVEWWKGSPETSPSSYILCHPGQACLTRDPVFLKQPSDYETKHHIQYTVSSRPEAVIQSLGWQSPFATETVGLFQTGNSVASAEQTPAALILSALICVNRVTT